jgi:hypothetical protein
MAAGQGLKRGGWESYRTRALLAIHTRARIATLLAAQVKIPTWSIAWKLVPQGGES